MSLGNNLSRAHVVVLGVLILFAFIELVITGVLVGSYNRHDDYPNGSVRDRVRFLLFASVFSIVLLPAYLAGFFIAPTNFLLSIASHVAGFGLMWIFWLAGAASWSAEVGDYHCDDGIAHCHQIEATEAFAWMIWILMTLSLGFVLYRGSKAARSGHGFGGGLVEEA